MKWSGRLYSRFVGCVHSTCSAAGKGRREQEVRERERERQVEWKSFNQLSILLALPDTWRYAIHRGTAAAAHLSNTHTGPNVWVRWEVLEAWTIQCRLQFLFLSCTHMGAVGGTIDGGILHSPPRVASVPFTKRGRERERRNTFQIARLTDSLSYPHNAQNEMDTNPEGQTRCFLLLGSIGFSFSARHSSRAEKSATGIVSWKSYVINGAYTSVGSW